MEKDIDKVNERMEKLLMEYLIHFNKKFKEEKYEKMTNPIKED